MKKDKVNLGPEEEILDVGGVAKLLKISNYGVYKLAKEGKIPGLYIGNKWRFSKAKIIETMGKPSPKK
ncbi:hypothetical protein ES705_25203 [subsurface metagenome]